MIHNTGRKTARNVRIQFDVDSFTARGDIEGRYSGDEPVDGVVKNVDYKSDLRLTVIPELPPGVRQEFVYIEMSGDSDIHAGRREQASSRTREGERFPRVSLITTDDGLARVIRAAVNLPCPK